MYLISAYFDEKSSKLLAGYIDRIAEKTGNDFMKKNHVPPHLTISSLEAKDEKLLLPCFEAMEGRFYQPLQWFPHVTLGKTLTKEEMRIAFEVMQHRFAPFEGRIISLGLAKVNPHEDLRECSLEMNRF